MSRVHDMGGRFGDGPVRRDADPEPVFKEKWQAHALALTLAAGSLGRWSLDESRHARECLEPRDYMRFSYYEKWLAGLTDLLVAKLIVTPEELSSLSAQPAAPELQQRRLPAAKVAAVLSSGGPTLREEAGNGIAFELGQKLRVRRSGNLAVAGGHSRLPAYVMGQVGTPSSRFMATMFFPIATPIARVKRRSHYIRLALLRMICGKMLRVIRIR